MVGLERPTHTQCCSWEPLIRLIQATLAYRLKTQEAMEALHSQKHDKNIDSKHSGFMQRAHTRTHVHDVVHAPPADGASE